MRARYHVVVSTSLSLVLYGLWRSVVMAVACWVVGVFMDLDHMLEYFVQRGPLRRLRDLFHASYNRGYTKAYLVLHGWEFLVLWAVLLVLTRGAPWVVGAAVGFVHHLALDQVWNRPAPWAYSFLWRARHRSSYDATFPPRDRRRECASPDEDHRTR